jgi:hypothetical protein
MTDYTAKGDSISEKEVDSPLTVQTTTDHTADGGSVSEKEIDSLLTVGDLIRVLDTLFGKGENIRLF